MRMQLKSLIAGTMLSACTISLWAQTPQASILLQTNESGASKSYIARESVSLKPGFSYSATTGQTFNAKIDPYLIDPNPYASAAVVAGSDGGDYVVGVINGSSSVTPSGASTYEMPIKAPSGTGGMTPQLSVVYSSQGGDGLLGVGFSINGLSSISRAPSNLDDGGIKPVSFNSNDRFSLDGNRLVAITGAYGANGTEYRTENNSFSKIISYTSTTTGPESFKVYTKSGLIYEYGNTTDSKFKAQNSEHVITWLLNRVTDSKGNYYSITYIQDRINGEYLPSRIDYTGNDSTTPALSPYYSIQFGYTDRSVTNLTFLQGNKSIVKHLLTSIDVYSNTTKIKSYNLSYNIPNYGKYLLNKVTESSSTGEKINPIKFNWFTNSSYAPTERVYDTSYNTSQFVKNTNEVCIGDFNGDGRSDLLATPKSGIWANQWALMLSNGSTIQYQLNNTGTTMDGFVKMYPGDFNGDGKTDVIQCRKVGGSTCPDCTNYFVYYSTGTGFTYAGPAFLTETESHQLIVGDFNGDGISDALFYYPGTKKYRTFSSSFYGGVLHALEEKSIRYIDKNWDRVEVGDFNGDGLPDIMNLTGDGYTIISSTGLGTVEQSSTGTNFNKDNISAIGDFNGDGKADIIEKYVRTEIVDLPEDQWYNAGDSQDPIWITTQTNTYNDYNLIYSTGNGFSTKSLIFTNNAAFDIKVGDFNGDGKDDFFTVDKSGFSGSFTTMHFYISDGSNTGFSHQLGANVYSTDVWAFLQGDFNGDGRSDCLITSTTGQWGGFQLLMAITDRDKLLRNVIDSYDNITSFTYKPLTNSSVYTPYTNGVYPVSDFTSAMQVVEKMTQPDGIGGTKSTSYKYEGAKLHKQGKGFLGFSKFTATDNQTGISSISMYEYDPAKFCTALKRSETRLTDLHHTNVLLSEVDYTNTYKTYDGFHTPYIYTYQPTSTTEKKYEIGEIVPYSTTASSYTYDDYGNVLTTTQNFGTEATITTVNEYTNDLTNWYLGRLTSSTVTKHVPNKVDAVRKSTFEYNPSSGLLTKEIVEPDNTLLGFSKTYEHDSYGNILKSTTVANGVSRSQRSVYDSKGRFAIEEYDGLEHKTSKIYDPDFGTVTSITDANQLTATTTYDSFGREKVSTGLDGSKSIVVYRWSYGEENAPIEALWFKYAEVSGKPGAKQYYDSFGRVIRKETVGFDGRSIFVDTKYNALGQTEQQSDPYFKGETAQWTTFGYDVLGRLTQKILADGSVIGMAYDGLTTTTTNPLGKKDIRETNQQGQLIKSTDNNGQAITYVYNSAGNMTEMHDPRGNVVKMEYDLLGNRTKLIDPELGTTTSVYNAFGELTSETDAKGNLLTMEYDGLGRLKKRIEKEGTTEWIYDTGTCGIGRVNKVTGANGYVQEMIYDNLGRTIAVKETIAGTTYTTSTVYDSYSRVLKVNYPSAKGNGPVVRNSYNENGFLLKVSDNQNGKVYWTANKVNARGQMTESLYGNGMLTNRTYNDVTGLLNHIKTAKGTTTVQDWEYGFDAIGNLTLRRDDRRGAMAETFGYDELNRLTHVYKNGTETLAMTYDELGNILSKSDVGTYQYEDASKPHQVTGITRCAGSLLKTTEQHIYYTSFDKVGSIAQGSDSLYISYGAAYERKYADSYSSNILVKRRIYVGNLYEQEKEQATGKVKEKFYIFGGDGLVALQVSDDAGSTLSYVHKDHLGSMQCLTSEAGALAQEMSYDAWGNRRNADTWQVYTTAPAGLIFDRGFTGHEHIDLFDLVNMDGRVYDPVIGRFLSADPVIQDPENLQSLNRYSYCLNNPLSLVDPSGYSWLSRNWRSLLTAAVAITVSVVTLGGATALSAVILSGAAGGFAGGFVGTLLNGGDLGQAFVSGIVGGLRGGASGFLNFAAGFTEATSALGQMFERAAKHAFVEAFMGSAEAFASGGNMGQAMLHGMFSGALSSAGNGFINSHVDGLALKMTASAVLGGTISEIGGGKFANGAVTGAYSMLFNETMHEIRVKRNSAWFGSNFIGPGPDVDPNKLKDENGNKLKPIDESDAAAFEHDDAYFKAKASGIKGALLEEKVRFADRKLAIACAKTMTKYLTGGVDIITGKPVSYATFNRAYAICFAFSEIATYKQVNYNFFQH